MSYFFPNATRKERRQKTVDDFEKHYQVISDIEERLLGEFTESVPLWESVTALRVNDEGAWAYEDWRDLYIKSGWTAVQGESWFETKTKPLNSEDLEELEFKGKEEPALLEGSENWNDFVKTIDGVDYINSFPVDKQKYWLWIWWFKVKDTFKERLHLIINASYDVDCLEFYTSIYLHEAFLIMLGVSPDYMDRKAFAQWSIGSMPLNFEELNHPETNADWFKKDYRDYKEWQVLLRQFGQGKRGLMIEIDTREFIEWALRIGIIEENTAHFRDGRKAPYEESFSKILHKELLAHDLIKEGKHHHEWAWNTAVVGNGSNSFNYLGRLLALNMVPMKYWLPLDRNYVSWENLGHYIVGVKNPKNQVSIPNNARVIEDVVMRLMEEHDKRDLTEYQDLD